MKELGIFGVLIILTLIFSFLSPEFLHWNTISNILKGSTELGIIALFLTLLIIAGEFDLSVGSNMALSGMLFAILTSKLNIFAPLSLLIVLVLACLIGFLNAKITLKYKLPSFIVTLGSMLICRAIVLVFSNGFPVTMSKPDLITSLFSYEIGLDINIASLIWLALVLILHLVLNFTRFGNALFASGGNPEGAFMNGVDVARTKTFAFIGTSFAAGLAGVLQYSHLETISPIAGQEYELRAIAIAVIGGTALTGGKGSIIGTTIGTLILAVVASGLVQSGVSNYWFRAFVGLTLVLAVIINSKLETYKTKRAQNA